jgi:hypothetical protein
MEYIIYTKENGTSDICGFISKSTAKTPLQAQKMWYQYVNSLGGNFRSFEYLVV